MDLIRTGLDIGIGRWKALLAAFVLFSVIVMGIEGAAAVAALSRGTEGQLGVKGDPAFHNGRYASQVRSFEEWSLVPQAGVQAGDLLQLDRWYDWSRSYRPGEELAATVVREGQVLPVRLKTRWARWRPDTWFRSAARP